MLAAPAVSYLGSLWSLGKHYQCYCIWERKVLAKDNLTIPSDIPGHQIVDKSLFNLSYAQIEPLDRPSIHTCNSPPAAAATIDEARFDSGQFLTPPNPGHTGRLQHCPQQKRGTKQKI